MLASSPSSSPSSSSDGAGAACDEPGGATACASTAPVVSELVDPLATLDLFRRAAYDEHHHQRALSGALLLQSLYIVQYALLIAYHPMRGESEHERNNEIDPDVVTTYESRAANRISTAICEAKMKPMPTEKKQRHEDDLDDPTRIFAMMLAHEGAKLFIARTGEATVQASSMVRARCTPASAPDAHSLSECATMCHAQCATSSSARRCER